MKILVTGGSGFIGTNYINLLLEEGFSDFINIDIKTPRNREHNKFWHECDILDKELFAKEIKDFQPTHILHLAAKTGLDEKNFATNIEGVENLVNISCTVPSVKRVVFTSTLLVCEMGYVPQRYDEYKPTTLYGKSKVEGEKIVRSAQDLPFSWVITRPISIWGPYAQEPYRNFFDSVRRNWYFHIGSGHYQRSMGYVGNTAYQNHKLLLAPDEKVDKKTFYLGDRPPIDLYDFANEVQKQFKSRRIKRLPLGIVKLMALTGDILKFLGWKKVPLTSFRLKNIRTEYVFNLDPIFDVTGPLPYNFQEGIKKTVEFLT